MPLMPVYISKENINTGPVAPELHQASEAFKANAQMIDTMQKVTQGLSDAHDVQQYTVARTNIESALAGQEMLAKDDPNPDNMKAHLSAIEDITKNATKGIDNQEVAARLGFETQHAVEKSHIELRNIFAKKQMFANDMALDKLSTAAAHNVSGARSVADAMHTEGDFMDTVQMNAVRGNISAERAQRLVDTYRMNKVSFDIQDEDAASLDASKVMAQLNNPEGKYKDLSLQQKTEAQRMVRAHIRDNLEMGIGKKLDSRVDTIKKIASGDLGWQNTAFIGKVAASDPKLAEAMQAVFDRNALGKEYQPAKDEDESFAKMANDLFATKTKEEVGEYLINTLHTSANRNMSRDRLAILVNAAEKRGATLPTMAGSTNGKDDPAQEEVEAAVKHIQEHVKDNPGSENVVVKFFKNLFSGHAPSAAKDDAIKSYNVKQYPWLGSVPKEGAVYRDKVTGAKRRIFPDGSFQEVK